MTAKNTILKYDIRTVHVYDFDALIYLIMYCSKLIYTKTWKNVQVIVL